MIGHADKHGALIRHKEIIEREKISDVRGKITEKHRGSLRRDEAKKKKKKN